MNTLRHECILQSVDRPLRVSHNYGSLCTRVAFLWYGVGIVAYVRSAKSLAKKWGAFTRLVNVQHFGPAVPNQRHGKSKIRTMYRAAPALHGCEPIRQSQYYDMHALYSEV